MHEPHTAAAARPPLLGTVPAGMLPDGTSEDCPCRPILDRLGDRWSAAVIALLADHPLCHGELQRRTGASRKVLTQTLRALERDGIVIREVLENRVVRVRYSLTDTGRTLEKPLAALRDWAQEHLPTLAQAQQSYDRDPPLAGVTQIRQRQAAAVASGSRLP